MTIDHNCPLRREAIVAFEAATAAAQLCAKIRLNCDDLKVMTKSDESPITIADVCAEAVVNERIKQDYPEDCIIGEEDETDVSDQLFANVKVHLPILQNKESLKTLLQSRQPTEDSKRYWAVDPIDGTKGFIRGDQYAVCIALVDGGSQKSLLAALGCPNLEGGIVLIAIKGYGVYRAKLGDSFEKLERISPAAMLDSFTNAQFTGAFESLHTKSTEIESIMAECDNDLPLLKMDSQCKYALLALKTAQIYYRRHASNQKAVLGSAAYSEAIWDNAPGVLFVEEAGGQVTDFAGNELSFPPAKHFKVVGGIVASTLEPHLHAQLVQIIRRNLE